MRLSLVNACLLIAAVMFTATSLAQAGLSEIQGTWREISRTRDGTAMTGALGTMTQDATGKTTTSLGGRVVYEGTATVGMAGAYKSIDFVQTSPNEGKGQIRQGIYELSGDTLRVCLARPGMPRPSEFVSAPGSGLVLSVYTRER